MAEQSNITRWSKTAVTDVGTSLLTEFAAGRLLTITSAFGSISDPGDNLVELTELPDGREHPLTIESVTRTDEGVTVCIQVTSLGNPEPYKLERIGIFAAAGGDDGEMEGHVGREKLLMVIEDVEDENGSKGVTIPAETDQLYTFKLYAVLTITNKERLEVSVSSVGIATVGAIEEAVKKHDADPTAHRSLAARMSAAEVVLNGGETILDTQPPDTKTEGVKGQHYIDRDGTEFVCTDVTEEGYIWEVWEDVDKSAFAAQPKLTGQPGQVVGFDADGSAAPVRGWSNQNLLDNSYFADPINQRGQTEYAAAGYCLDRVYNGTNTKIAVNDDSISIFPLGSSAARGIRLSTMEAAPFVGKTVTFSVLIEPVNIDNGLTPYIHLFYGNAPNLTTYSSSYLSGNFYAAILGKQLLTYTTTVANYPYMTACILSENYIQGVSQEYKVYAAKLELGTQQTLAHQDADGNWVLNDPPPNKALELAKCQRYLQRIVSAGTYDNMLAGVMTGNAGAQITVPLPTTLRSKPAISFSGEFTLNEAEGSAFKSHPVTAMSCYTVHDGSMTMSVTTSDTVQTGAKAILMGKEIGAYIDIDSNI